MLNVIIYDTITIYFLIKGVYQIENKIFENFTKKSKIYFMTL